MSCFWFHKWEKWEDKFSGRERYTAVEVKPEEKDGYPVIIQMRRCTRCNAVDMRKVSGMYAREET